MILDAAFDEFNDLTVKTAAKLAASQGSVAVTLPGIERVRRKHDSPYRNTP
jgi:hypothetical protein